MQSLEILEIPFRLNILGALFDCALKSKRLRIQYPERDNLSNCAHLPGIISSNLDYMTAGWGLMKTAGNLPDGAIQLESIIATDAINSRQT
jgi:hypothetical protein